MTDIITAAAGGNGRVCLEGAQAPALVCTRAISACAATQGPETGAGMFQNILLSQVAPDPDQPRKHFDQGALDELAQSIGANGLAVPILVRPHGDGYMLVHGERRYRAALSLGWETIPAEVRRLSDKEARRLSLIENIQRESLSPIEEARAYGALLAGGMTQGELGKQVGKGQSYIAQKLRLIRLPLPLIILVDRGAITENHARQLMTLKGMYQGATTEYAKGPDAPIDAFAILAVRPLDRIDWIPLKGPHCQTVTDSWSCFFNETREGGRFPSWERVALWYGTLAAIGGLSVVELSQCLERFMELIASAVFYVCDSIAGRRSDPPPSGTAEFRWWGHRADLRHAGIDEDSVPDEMRKWASDRVMRAGSSSLPSNCQRGGEYFEAYMEADDMERTKRMEWEAAQ